jgi:hypothetical protein
MIRATRSRSASIQPHARHCNAADLASSAKKIQKMIAKTAFLELLEDIKKNGGNSSRNYGEYKKTINRYHALGHTWMNRRHLTYQMERHLLLKDSLPKTCNISNATDDMSTLTPGDHIADVNTQDASSCNIGGRPKGSTCTAKENYTLVLKKATTDASILYQKEKMAAEAEKRNVSKGRLKQIVQQIENERGLPPNTIPLSTIRNRILRNNVNADVESSLSPLKNVEPIIVEYCVRLARIGNALNKDQVISLAEDVIHGTSIANDLAKFKSDRKIKDIYHHSIDNQQRVIVGEGWYNNFMKRNKYKIKRQRLKVKDRQRLTYCTYPNFQIMYETVYEDMVKCGIAIKLDKEVLVNYNGEIVYEDNESDGLPTKYIITNTYLLVFVDETGNNTNQKADPFRGNEKRIVPSSGDGFGLAGAVNDNHFTFLCFQSGSGEPIMCAIIFKSERKKCEIPETWKSGIDIRKLRNETILPDSQDDIAKLYIEEETLNGGALGGGPVCTFRGKTIACYCTCSPNASITSSILTDLLRTIDKHEVYDRVEGTKPLLLLDGHHSRMDLEFLEYINQPGTEWNVCIGVPYGTHLWQVADSSQVNGKFKIEMTKEKCQYMKYKTNTTGLLVTDIVPIVNGAFKQSFANVANAKKAIAERGWGPALNYRLLLDDRLSLRPTEEAVNQPVTTATTTSIVDEQGSVTLTFNMKKGWFSEMTDVLLDRRNQDKGREEAIQEKMSQMKNQTKHMELIRNLPKISSGKLMSNGWLHLDETVRDNKRQQQEMNQELEKQRLAKRQKQQDGQHQRYQTAINKCIETKQTLTMADLTALMKQATEKGDSPVRKGRTDIIQQLERRINRLAKYLPSSSFQTVMAHIVTQPVTKTKKNKTYPSDMFHNLGVGNMSDFEVLGTSGTANATSSEIENDNISEDVASTLLNLATGGLHFCL